MAEHIVGYIVSFLVIVGIAWGLPRWFVWRHSIRRRLLEAMEDNGHV